MESEGLVVYEIHEYQNRLQAKAVCQADMAFVSLTGLRWKHHSHATARHHER